MSDSDFIESDNEKRVEAPKAKERIKHTVESMLRQMETSKEEIEYRIDNFDNVDIINKEEYIKYLKCTKCNLKFKNSINQGKTVGVHPLLGVLMCSSCCDYYGDGNFSLDSEGEDKYCRWCGEGGTIFACSRCICGFCALCIKKHFGEDGLEAVKNDDDWACYFCNPKPLWCLRSICSLAKEAAHKKKECIEKNKMSGGLKKKKRTKKEVKSISNDTSSDSSNSKDISSSKKMKQEKLVTLKEKADKDESSSGDSVRKSDSSVILRRKLRKNKNRWLNKNMKEELTESIKSNCNKNTKNQSNSDKNDTSKFEADIKVSLEKLISIWKLIQTVTEVGLNSSCKRLKLLSKTDNFKTEEILQKEHEKLKSCMNVLMSSLSTAYDSVNCINEDTNNEIATNEREILQSQETKFKKFATEFRMESNEASDFSSDGDSSSESEDWNKLMLKKRGKKKSATRKLESRAKVVKENKCERDNSSNKKRREKKKISSSLFSDPGSDVEEKSDAEENKKARDKNKENSNLNKGSGSGGPFLKVKSFARMYDDNLYDKIKKSENPVVINLGDNDTDGSEDEKPKEEEPIKGKCKGPEEIVSFAERPRKEDCSKQTNCLDENESRESNNFTSEKNVLSSDKKNLNESLSERAGKNEKNYDDNESKSSSKSIDNESKGISITDKEEKLFIKSGEIKKKESLDENETEPKKVLSKKKESEKSDVSSEDEKAKIERIENKNLPDGENESGKESSNVGDERITVKKRLSFKGVESKNKKNNESEQSQEENKQSSSDMNTVKRKNKKKILPKNVESGDEKNSSDSENEPNKKTSSEETTENSGELSDEKQERTKKLRNKKEKKTLKASFRIFKRKRENFLRSSLLKKTSERKSSIEEEVKSARVLDSSDSESEKKKNGQRRERQKRKRILESSEDENQEEAARSSDEDESEEDKQTQMSHSEDTKFSSSKYSGDDEKNNFDRGKKRKKKEESSDTESFSEKETKRSRKKRKRSNSTSDGDEKKKTKGRKNINRILKKDSLQVETKEALKNEEERKKRIREKQKLFEELFPQQKQTPKEIILDFDPKTKEPLVKVHKKLAQKLKPHQAEGVKFMWDSCFESVEKLEEDSGSGCILAHCMGLGKTLQVITLVHTVMTHDLGMNTVLIICPLSTVSNWIREFEVWLENIHTDPITLYDLLKHKKKEERRFFLNDWHENGGVLVLSYDLFRTLTKGLTNKKNSNAQKILEKTLLDPGPDLVVCDEGHLLKNEKTTLSKSVNRIKTSRRIILTGTPLQNNLAEYYCMVQFVKPNILGTKKEFCNRFVNPINNGQFEDSTELDVKIMKRRSHVLHSMLDGCIQRFDYSVLTPFLPEKYEYVLSISLTEAQTKAYMHFISNISAKSLGNCRATSLFYDYQYLQRIWTHPRTMLMQSEKAEQKELFERNSDDSLKDFVVSSDEDSSTSASESSDVSLQEVTSKKRVLRSNANDLDAVDEVEELKDKHWWDEFYGKNVYDDLRESNKLLILFSLLKYCREINDKVLVFSQSLYSLDLIEYFLGKINDNDKNDNEALCGYRDSWVLGSDYFRLDGSTNSETRIQWCKYFNQESNTRTRLFLISTKAGGLGINLYGANRVVIFDASWNPSHDLQSIFRVYRFGQKKPCYVYRFLSEATMEEKIYERQVTKLSLAHRVVDEHQIERHYTMGNLQELYAFDPIPKDQKKVPKLPKDSVLADILTIHKDVIAGYHEHDSLLENKQEEELSEEERKAAWRDYEEEKAQKTSVFDFTFQQQILLMQQAHQEPALTQSRVLNPACFASTLDDLGQSSVLYEVIRRFVSKGFENPFCLQLLANTLNDVIRGSKVFQKNSGLSFEVKKQEETPTTKQEMENLSLKEKPALPEPRNSEEHRGFEDKESYLSDASRSTVFYLDITSPACDQKSEIPKSDTKKEDFFSTDSDISNSSFYQEHVLSEKKQSKTSVISEKKSQEEGKNSAEKSDGEEKELEKLLRMTEINLMKNRVSSCDSGKDLEEKGEQKEKNTTKVKEKEVSLLDCLDSENCESNSIVDLQEEEEEENQIQFFSLLNDQIKKTFLLSSDESLQSSEESGCKRNSELEKEPQKKAKVKAKSKINKKKDGLSEFRIVSPKEKVSRKEDSEGETLLTESSSSSDESVQYVQHVNKRKRMSSDFSEQTTDIDSESDCQETQIKTECSPTKGRKNIKKILRKESLQVETKQALKVEMERKKRVNERQKLFDKFFSNANADSKLILDFDLQTKKELVVVDDKLTQQLKPHQREGIQFMWNCCFESLKRMEEDSGSGCVLAHCMGLGKTLQVITLIHTLFTHNTGVQTVMIICPLNTIRNWVNEFEIWQKECKTKIKPVNLMPYKSKTKRVEKVKSWSQEGGVLVISYEMFRLLIKKDNTNLAFTQGFLDPGPDLVVCDEGHILKNNSSALSKSMSQIKTLRRIILTGTPLQNNLMEYYCMVQFVKPNILGTMKEFRNRFVHPINNGQFEDSTELDVVVMKRRAHVLHTMLEGFVQRLGYYVLTPFLPEKQEYVISIALTETQENIYRLYIEQCNQENRGLLKDFHLMQMVWTHPRMLLMYSIKNNKQPDFIGSQWQERVQKEEFSDIGSSGKLFLLFNILKRSKEIKDKVLVFSQSLLSLKLIEFFLAKANQEFNSGVLTEYADSWVLGEDYYRLDGSTSSETRDLFCRKFNDVKNERFRLFLVSTKAGGLGINLIAANRVVVFDASWNPVHDVQSIFRVYRFGQKKPCFIYRFLAASTMEEKIYKRQVTKLSLAHRILDEHQIERHYTMGNLQELYRFDPIPKSEWKVPKIPRDNLFAEVLAISRDRVVGYHEHDSLLENKEEEELTEEDRKAAWEDYEKEKLTPENPQPLLNGLMGPLNLSRINSEGLRMVHRYKQGTAIPNVFRTPVEVNQSENQMCRIVNVRTLNCENNIHSGMEAERMIEIGHSFGLNPFDGETLERYCKRIEETIKTIQFFSEAT